MGLPESMELWENQPTKSEDINPVPLLLNVPQLLKSTAYGVHSQFWEILGCSIWFLIVPL